MATGTIDTFPLQGTIGTTLKPKRYDIEIYQGDTFEVVFTFKDAAGTVIDLTGFTFVTKFVGVGTNPTPATQPAATAAAPTNGQVLFSIIDTTALTGVYDWDLQLVQGTKKRTYIGGVVTVTADITP